MIMLHVSAGGVIGCPVGSVEWEICNVYDSMVRWCVPVFVMISGALFLGRDVSMRNVYKKNILRLAVAYVVWCVVYYVSDSSNDIIPCLKDIVCHPSTLIYVLSGRKFHLWFLPMLIGLYMSIPILKSIAQNTSARKHFVCLSLFFMFVVTFVSVLVNAVSLSEENLLLMHFRTLIDGTIVKIQPEVLACYACYFILGYYLNKCMIINKRRMIVYLLGIMGYVMTVYFTRRYSLCTSTLTEQFYGYNTINVCFLSMAIFVFFKYSSFSYNRFYRKIIVKLSNYSFGAYLIHILWLEFLRSVHIDALHFSPSYAVPVVTIVIAVLSYASSAILNQIPIIKKYVV